MSKKLQPIPETIILGIDPGTTRIGYGVIKKSGSVLKLLDYGIIEPGGNDNRFKILEKLLNSIINKYKPSLAAVEKIYFSKNKKTAMSVAEYRGIILFILKKKIKTVLEFDPNNIKLAITGSGNSDKKTISEYVCLTLGIDNISGPDDASDALAVAIRAAFEREPARW